MFAHLVFHVMEVLCASFSLSLSALFPCVCESLLSLCRLHGCGGVIVCSCVVRRDRGVPMCGARARVPVNVQVCMGVSLSDLFACVFYNFRFSVY